MNEFTLKCYFYTLNFIKGNFCKKKKSVMFSLKKNLFAITQIMEILAGKKSSERMIALASKKSDENKIIKE